MIGSVGVVLAAASKNPGLPPPDWIVWSYLGVLAVAVAIAVWLIVDGCVDRPQKPRKQDNAGHIPPRPLPEREYRPISNAGLSARMPPRMP